MGIDDPLIEHEDGDSMDFAEEYDEADDFEEELSEDPDDQVDYIDPHEEVGDFECDLCQRKFKTPAVSIFNNIWLIFVLIKYKFKTC